MRLTGGDRRALAAVLAAGAAMPLCLALEWAGAVPLDPLPRALPTAADTAGAVDINAAGLEELMSLPGIGEVRAQAILEDREKNGPYRYPEDLIRVRGIGEGILEHILDRITTGGDQDAEDFGG